MSGTLIAFSFILFRTAVRHRSGAHPLHGPSLGRVVSRASTNYQSRQAELALQRTRTAQSDGPITTELDGHYEMLVEHPFDSTIKRMSTAWQFIPEDSGSNPADYDLLVCEWNVAPASNSLLNAQQT